MQQSGVIVAVAALVTHTNRYVLQNDKTVPVFERFPFYNPDSHRHLVRMVEEKAPAAVIAATGRNPELAGAWYPFPLFEDGDFDIPNAYIKDVDGAAIIGARGAAAAASHDPAESYGAVAPHGPTETPRPAESYGAARLIIRSSREEATCEQIP